MSKQQNRTEQNRPQLKNYKCLKQRHETTSSVSESNERENEIILVYFVLPSFSEKAATNRHYHHHLVYLSSKGMVLRQFLQFNFNFIAFFSPHLIIVLSLSSRHFFNIKNKFSRGKIRAAHLVLFAWKFTFGYYIYTDEPNYSSFDWNSSSIYNRSSSSSTSIFDHLWTN